MEKRLLNQVERGHLLGWRRIGVIDPLDSNTVDFVVAGYPGDGLAAPTLVPVGFMSRAIPQGVAAKDEDAIFLPPYSDGPATHEPWLMYRSLVSTEQYEKGMRATCAVCGSEFPKIKMRFSKGRWYCWQKGCKEDADD